MAITIYSNISSLMAQRRLGQSTADLRRSFERLSSGLRINRASDDAAGLAIADSLNADSRVLAQGVRNVNDAISYLNIAEEAVRGLTTIIERQRELAAQSANGTLTNTQRTALDEEAQALALEYNRIVEISEFNGRQVLDSNFTLSVQVGYDTIDGVIGEQLGRAAGDGTFQDMQNVSTSINNPPSVRAADFNQDGKIDLVATSFTGNYMGVALGNGDGTFGAFSSNAGSRIGNNATLEIGDVNGDGYVDVINPDSYNRHVSVFLGKGDGTFQTRVSFRVGVRPQDIELADYDEDGTLDMVVVNTDSDDISMLLGNGDGTFKAAITLNGTTDNMSIKAADFDSDGNIDFAIGSGHPWGLFVTLGNGNGTFQSQADIT